MHIMVEVVFLLLGMLTPLQRCLRVLLGAVLSSFFSQWLEHLICVWNVLGSIPVWNSEIFLSSSLHTYHSVFIIYCSESIYKCDCTMQLICVFIWHNMTARCGPYVSPQMTCSTLEFTLAQWLGHLISVWKVVGSFSHLGNFFWVLLSTHILLIYSFRVVSRIYYHGVKIHCFTTIKPKVMFFKK